MVRDFEYILWSEQASKDLENIFYHYMIFSPETANKRILKIISATENIKFYKQWEVDEIDKSCRRIIVGKQFRVLYKKVGGNLIITRVYPNKMNIKSNIF